MNKEDKLSAHKYLSRFAKLIRMNLDSSMSNLVPVSEEITRLDLYLQIELMRFEDKFEYTISIADDIDTESIEIPPMLLQPYVENSILHGILPANKSGRIDIRVELSELCRKVTAFENASGCTIDNRYAWRGVPPDRMGSALRFITDGGLGEYVSSFGGIVEQLETRINHLRGVLDTAKKFATPPQLHEPPPLAPSSAPVTNSTESPHVT
jgi:LytS/YehU family sensor histidine kinase